MYLRVLVEGGVVDNMTKRWHARSMGRQSDSEEPGTCKSILLGRVLAIHVSVLLAERGNADDEAI